MLRYVVLDHEMPPQNARPRHWDFMLEWGDVLRTWALAEPPQPNCSIAADPLSDHRTAYLDYEGPVSSDRGHVTRWDAGTYEIISQSRRELVVLLAGGKLVGRATISATSAGMLPSWHFIPAEPGADPSHNDNAGQINGTGLIIDGLSK